MSARQPTEVDKATLDDFITECNQYATLIGENENLQRKERKANQKIDRSLNKRPILTPSEEKFFNNISESFFKGAKKVVEQITESFSLSRHMRERARQHIGNLYLNAKDFFKTLPDSLNVKRMLKKAAIWALNALVAYQAWQLTKKIASDNGLVDAFNKFLEPTITKLTKLFKENVVPFTKKMLSFIETAEDWLGRSLSFMGNAVVSMYEAIATTVSATSSQDSALVMKILTSIFDTVIGFFTPARLWSTYITILELGGLNFLFSALGMFGITMKLEDNPSYTVSDANLDSYRQILRNYQLTTTSENAKEKSEQREKTIATLESDAIVTLLKQSKLNGTISDSDINKIVKEVRENGKPLESVIGVVASYQNQSYYQRHISTELVRTAARIAAENPARILSKEEYINYINKSDPKLLFNPDYGKHTKPTEEQIQQAYEAYKRYHEAQQILYEAESDGAYGTDIVPTILRNNINSNAYDESETMFYGAYNTGNQGYKSFKKFVDGNYNEINEIKQTVVSFVSDDFWKKLAILAEKVKNQYFQREEETNEIQSSASDSSLLDNITASKKEYNNIKPVAAEGTGNLSLVSRMLTERQEYLHERLRKQQKLYRELSDKYEKLVNSGNYESSN